jgi:mannose-6-phosphate isomerase-like protein (cupin superfamily)
MDRKEQQSTSGSGPRWPATPLRRVVTGNDPNGRSCVVADDIPAVVMEIGGALRLTQIWRTTASPRTVPLPADAREPPGPPALELGADGTFFAIMDIAPGDISKSERLDEILAMEGLQAARDRVAAHSNPVMHATNTIDYAIVLDGELTLVLDNEEVIVRTGDLIVQGGTSHSWINHTDRPARVLGVLVGAIRR